MTVSSVKLTAYVKRPPAASLGLGVLGSRVGLCLEFGLALGLVGAPGCQWGQWSRQMGRWNRWSFYIRP